MKTKSLFVVLLVIIILLIYFGSCYLFITDNIKNGSKEIITNYFNNMCNNCKFNYEFKKATYTDNAINVFIQVDSDNVENDYYRFVLRRNGYSFELVGVDNNIPPYIK